MDIPSSFWECCLPRKTQIAMAELIAPIIALRSHPEVFTDRAATYYIDNVVAVSALVLGASRAADLSKMGLAFSCMSHKLNFPHWIEWVASASNAADDGSRKGAAESTARSLGIPVSGSNFEQAWLRDILQASPAEIVRTVLG